MTVVPTGVRSDESGLLARLTLEQKVHLLTGADSWALHAESAVGLRQLITSDGPAGVRGARFDPSNPSTSLPCPVAVAATWDVELVEEIATALGREARSKGVDVLLAPTMNIIRTPLSGRGFECFSEDPLLTSRIAVAYVRGVQAAGVGATAKHYVANDSETERRSYVARISEGVLRELYLPPFEACVGEAGVFLVMAAYNAVNGPTMTANAILLHDVLKSDWGFSGVVISDWSATTTTVPSALAGLDLVMPGPDGPWGDKLVAAVRNGAVPEAEIDDKVARIFSLARRLGGFNGSLGAAVPELVDAGLLARVTSRSFVLLSNPRGLLPLKKANVRSVALIGPNAVEPQTQGGGSVRVLPSVRVNLAESLKRAFGGATSVTVHQGCLTSATVPSPLDGTLHDPVSGKPGARLEIRSPAGDVVFDAPIPSSVATWWDGLPEAVHQPGSEIVMRAVFRPGTDGPHVLGAAGAGRMRVTVNGTVLAEATSLFPGEVVEALGRPPELRVPISLDTGREVDVRVEYRPEKRFVTLRLGITPQRDDEELIEEAARAADESDVAVVVIGSAEGTESEGYDKDTMVLPGRQDELVSRVAAANPNTIVVVNSGMPVLMPWADQVAAVIQVWFPGQAFGEALADTLLGLAEPTGRLPITVPREEADSPVLRARPDAGDLVYREGLLVGYRGYDRTGTEPHFAFGHGLGYTDWTYDSFSVEALSITAGEDLTCTVKVRNSGKRAGREIVQVYLEAPD
ncbi:MAG TPA: glycoside hydrolase family 3 C-terminal domain-containing protein, partial [Candidatus Dormibacteraeota bacterium]|nr:glycoside hydrolase family 3 C-terminal domain-containing protein [Candidatus Dormibacteraeota bacterium]